MTSQNKKGVKTLIIYIAGPITSVWNYKANFAAAEFKLRGNIVFNPSLLPEGLPHEAYMPICYAMMDACDTVYFMHGWEKSKGARMELKYANEKKMRIEFEGSKNNEN